METNEEIERIGITRPQIDALEGIFGLSEKAFHLLMGATKTSSGRWYLEGPSESFDALVSDLSDEIYHEMSPPSQLKHLQKLYDRLSPELDDY